MQVLQRVRNNRTLRQPLLAVLTRLMRPLNGGSSFWHRAIYDAMPVPYLVVGNREKFVVSTSDEVIGRQLFLRSEFDLYKLDNALACLEREQRPKPHHLIDVGANIGSIAIPAVVRGLFATATAVEPHPGNLRLLRANVALNEVDDRVHIVASAVADVGGALRLQESATNSGHHSIGTYGIHISACRLDDIEVPAEKSLLWMDIEGYEGHALRGATRLLEANAPVVAEFNPQFLEEQDGLEMFCDALAGRRIFDLARPDGETTFERLLQRYRGSFTDVLAI
jgi:FkbM family methyltransferase